MSFGYALRKYRDARGLSLRELSTLSGIDHAYIHLLEKDKKTAPTDQLIDKLSRSLKLTPRRTQILRELVGIQTSPELVDLFDDDIERPIDLLQPLAQMSFRGRQPTSREDWAAQADRLEAFMSGD